MLLFAIVQFLLLSSSTAPSLVDLAPVAIIFILIVAAAGMTRGLDIFSFFGVTTLLGITRPGGGGAGKGLKSGKTRSKIKGAMKTYDIAQATAAGTGLAAAGISRAVAGKGANPSAGTPSQQAATIAAVRLQAAMSGLPPTAAGAVTMAVAHPNVSRWKARRLQSAYNRLQAAQTASTAALAKIAASGPVMGRLRKYMYNRAGGLTFPIPFVPIPIYLPRGAGTKLAMAQQQFNNRLFSAAKKMSVRPLVPPGGPHGPGLLPRPPGMPLFLHRVQQGRYSSWWGQHFLKQKP